MIDFTARSARNAAHRERVRQRDPGAPLWLQTCVAANDGLFGEWERRQIRRAVAERRRGAANYVPPE